MKNFFKSLLQKFCLQTCPFCSFHSRQDFAFCPECGYCRKKKKSEIKAHRNFLEYWDNRYAKERAFSYLDTDEGLKLYQHLAKIIHTLKGKKIMDVGCWHGNLLKYLEDIDQYTGFDISRLAIAKARNQKKPYRINLSVGDIRNLPIAEEVYDIIYFGGVLGYIKENVSLLNTYVKKYSPKYIIWQEPPQFYDLDPCLAALKKEGYEIVSYEKITLNINRFFHRTILVLKTNQLLIAK
jgi:SAM-dependent methyltransferase